jgi:hypothetical protein
VHKIAIVVAAVAAVAAGASAGASARGMHGFSRMGAATPGFSRFAGPHRFAFRHRFRHRFAFVGAAVPYGYDEGCYTRVWTRGGGAGLRSATEAGGGSKRECPACRIRPGVPLERTDDSGQRTDRT